ncbi:glycosyltransferase [Myxococcota bacterium]|nr:glycosyltransferase [Myxococcota bacterium]
MPRLVQLTHGYPPRHAAGTERYAARVSAGLAARGYTVDVIASARAPGRAQGEVLESRLPAEEGGGRLWEIVNNLPWRPLAQAERDPVVEDQVHRLLDRARPDVVHVQHLLFLSAGLRLPAPSLATLHDAWAFCPRGGTLLFEGKTPCAGPAPERCPACYGSFCQGTAREHQLGALAARLVAVTGAAPERLQGLWRRLPPTLRARAVGGPAPTPATAEELSAWLGAVGDAYRRITRRVAPSRYLAERATIALDAPVSALPHGLPKAQLAPHRGPRTGPLVFLGSLTTHKGPELVARAWGLRPGLPPLALYGPEVEPGLTARLPPGLWRGAIPNDAIPALLREARALVMGSIWPENAPLVALEARAAGCPVIAPRIGGLPELIEDGLDGRLYTPGDAEALADAMGEVVSRLWPDVRPPPTLDEHLDGLETLYQGPGA